MDMKKEFLDQAKFDLSRGLLTKKEYLLIKNGFDPNPEEEQMIKDQMTADRDHDKIKEDQILEGFN